MCIYRTALAAISGLSILSACGAQNDDARAKAENEADDKEVSARPSGRRSAHVDGYPHIPVEWDRNQGLITSGPVGLEYWAAYLKQNPEVLNLSYVQTNLTDLYSCADGERARNNEVERAGIMRHAADRFRDFLSGAPDTVTITIGKELGQWSAAQGAFGWTDDRGQSTMEPIHLAQIPVDGHSLHYACGESQGGLRDGTFWAPTLYAHYAALKPLHMTEEQASRLLDRLGGSRYVNIELTFDLRSNRAPDPVAVAMQPRDNLPNYYQDPVPFFEGYFRSGVVKFQGDIIAQF